MTAGGTFDHLTPERVWKELKRPLPDFPQFIRVARQCGKSQNDSARGRKALQTPERTDYHPEGTAASTPMTLEQAAKRLPENVRAVNMP